MADLFPTFRFGSIDLTSYPYAVVFGSDRGAPESVVESVTSALRDGSLTRVTKYDNRTVTIPVLIEGPTLGDLSEHEAALVAEAMKPRNEFTFNPGDGFAADSVYDTFTADLVPEYDDDLEANGYRRFSLTFTAFPWPRSAEKVVSPAVAAGSPTVVDDGSSTANWSTPVPAGASLSVVSGAVRSTYSRAAGAAALRRTAAISTTTEKYVSVDWKSSAAGAGLFRTSAAPSVNLPEIRRAPGAVAGFTRSWYEVPESVSSLSWVEFGVTHPAASGSATLEIDRVQASATIPVFGTARQSVRSIVPGGSVPAEGTIMVQHETAGLGETIVFSHPAEGGYAPPLRPWWHDGDPEEANPAALSGATNTLTNATNFHVPVSAIPEGDVQLWARIFSDAAGSFQVYWAADAWMGGVVVGDSQTNSTMVTWATANTYALVPLARLALPTANVGPAGYHRIRIHTPGDLGKHLDEAWLFAMDRGRLTVVNTGTGAPSTGSVANRLRILAPSPEKPNGSIEVGIASDWSDAFTPGSASIPCDQTGHRFDPEGSNIFVATTGTTDAAVSFEHYRRWHTNAGS